MNKYNQAPLSSLVRDCFVDEIKALKPGNVSQYADGHGMSYADFIASADVCTPILCDGDLGVGERVLLSVEATQTKVACNTNLGMLLLFSPIIKSYETMGNKANLKKNIKLTLANLDQTDAVKIFQAIDLANPGGLGQVDQHDVRFTPEISLLEAMEAAADRDLIARQYASSYEDVYKVGLRSLGEFDKRWNSVEWATVACYLSFMASYPDSHIRRKFGDDIARQVQNRMIPVFERFKHNNNPAMATAELLELDKELKDSNINPGTSADLTAASLLLYGITRLD